MKSLVDLPSEIILQIGSILSQSQEQNVHSLRSLLDVRNFATTCKYLNKVLSGKSSWRIWLYQNAVGRPRAQPDLAVTIASAQSQPTHHGVQASYTWYETAVMQIKIVNKPRPIFANFKGELKPIDLRSAGEAPEWVANLIGEPMVTRHFSSGFEPLSEDETKSSNVLLNVAAIRSYYGGHDRRPLPGTFLTWPPVQKVTVFLWVVNLPTVDLSGNDVVVRNARAKIGDLPLNCSNRKPGKDVMTVVNPNGVTMEDLELVLHHWLYSKAAAGLATNLFHRDIPGGDSLVSESTKPTMDQHKFLTVDAHHWFNPHERPILGWQRLTVNGGKMVLPLTWDEWDYMQSQMETVTAAREVHYEMWDVTEEGIERLLSPEELASMSDEVFTVEAQADTESDD